jgi:hypothetical protein
LTTSIDVVNYALELIGSQQTITSFNDVPVGLAANIIYVPTIQLVMWQTQPDFARVEGQALAIATGKTAPPGWTYVYTYPSDCVQMRYVYPAIWPPFDPQAIRSSIGFDKTATAAKVVWSTVQNAVASYTSSAVTENQWDSAFMQGVIRQLGNVLSMALAGRPEYARELLQQAEMYHQMAESLDESGVRP